MEGLALIDKILLEKVRGDINNNIGNEHYSVEHLAENIGLSRSMLHRRLKKTIGKSASELITEIRLERAVELLKKDSGTVSEIAYKVGFNSPGYFNKVFKKHYYISPGELLKNETLKEGVIYKKGDKLIFESKVSALLRFFVKIIVVVISIVLVAFVLIVLIDDKEVEERAIAVLPLNNLTGIEDSDYFVDGMHDALIGELGKISSIRVISRTSTLRYRDSEKMLKDIANELDVDCIVEGSVVRVGDSLSILIQLINVFPKERHLFAKEYNDVMPNTLGVQSSIANDIASQIDINLSQEEEKFFSNPLPVNPETYKAYLRGMHYLNKGTYESFEKGIDFLQGAIDNDPNDPFAYAGMALGYAIVGHGQLESEESFLSAVALAEKALNLDPDSDEAHCALSLLHLYRSWDWALAKKAFEGTLKSNPNNAIAHAHYAWYHVLFDDKEKCLYHARRATVLEPFSAAYHSWLGLIYYHYGEYEKARESALRALELNENSPYGNIVMGRINMHNRNFETAIAYHQRLPETIVKDVELGYTYVKSGQKNMALKLWNKLNELPDKKEINPCHWGRMAAYLGFTDRAFELLSQAIEQKVYPITYFNFFPFTESIRHDPRYNDLLRKMNLPDDTALFTQNK